MNNTQKYIKSWRNTSMSFCIYVFDMQVISVNPEWVKNSAITQYMKFY